MSAAGNQTGDYVLTNSRIVTVLSLLGFEFSNKLDLGGLVEYDFDVMIYAWEQPSVIIAHGSMLNANHLTTNGSGPSGGGSTATS